MITAYTLENINLKLSFVIIVFGIGTVQGKAKTCSLHTDCDLRSACVNGVCVNPCNIRKCGPNSKCETVNQKSRCVCNYGFVNKEFGCVIKEKTGITTNYYWSNWGYIVDHHFPRHILAFKLKAANDGRIILRKKYHWDSYLETDSKVEIIIGGPHNNNTVIRRDREDDDKAVANTPDILSKKTFRGFWINFTAGEYTFGREFEKKPLVQWKDPDPFIILSFGIASGSTETAEWIIHGKRFKTPRDTEYIFRPMIYVYGVLDCHANDEVHLAFHSHSDWQMWYLRPKAYIYIGQEDNTVHSVYFNQEDEANAVFHKPGRILNKSDNTVSYQIHWSQGRFKVKNIHNQEGVIFTYEFPSFFQPTSMGMFLKKGWSSNFTLFRTSSGYDW